MKYSISRVAVIGAGTMGAAIAAHLANAGIRVLLLDIIPSKLTPEQEVKGFSLDDKPVRNSIVHSGLERAKKSRPASFMSEDRTSLVQIGNLEDDFNLLKDVDWIIEVIVENLLVKRDLMTRIDQIRSEKTIISTNTSGIPIQSIANGLSEGFRRHFLGTHFFNPPRYLKLLEIIPSDDTSPDVLDTLRHFCEYRLGKGVVVCKDTPNFIGNRIAFGSGAFALDFILRNEYSVEEVDAITGPIMGRPKTATFRLIDLVGIDVWDHVGRNLADAIPHDMAIQPYLKSEAVNTLMQFLLQKGWLGNKANTGFYKPVRKNGSKEFWSLNLHSYEHEPPAKVRFDSIGKARDQEDLGSRLKTMLDETDKAAQLVQTLTYQSLAYAAGCIPEIADTPKPIDDAMRWGFSHEAGPFETWDLLGVADTAERMNQAGFEPANWVAEMLASGFATFYQYQGERKVGVYNPGHKSYDQILPPESVIVLKNEKTAGRLVQRNPGASLIDLGDGVACVEFHTKMNALDEDIFTLVSQSLDQLERGEYEGLVIGNEAENFSAGANLGMVLLASHMGMWDTLEAAIDKLQQINMRMRYSSRPIVIAPAGLTLGGGAEVTMHGSRVVAAAELYSGLVEVGAGVIPAGAGTKEMLRRNVNPAMRTKNADPLPYLQRVFEQVGTARVGTSAEEVRQMGILSDCDRIVMNRAHLIYEAKREVLYLLENGFAPPVPEKIYAAGRDALAALRVGIFMYQRANQITEYDAVVAEKLAFVLTGGELSMPTWVDEQYILNLEKEAFLSLCGQEKTRHRMKHILDTGKPLRN